MRVQAHSSVDKGIMLAGVRMRKLRSTKVVTSPVAALVGNYTVEASVLEAAIAEDKALGYIPFVLVAIVGSTNTCAVDPLAELGKVCAREGIWLHVDAAYAGTALSTGVVVI
jgi:glutamate/tyrosine decarboxylase-like PLP-dependent enzyme